MAQLGPAPKPQRKREQRGNYSLRDRLLTAVDGGGRRAASGGRRRRVAGGGWLAAVGGGRLWSSTWIECFKGNSKFQISTGKDLCAKSWYLDRRHACRFWYRLPEHNSLIPDFGSG